MFTRAPRFPVAITVLQNLLTSSVANQPVRYEDKSALTKHQDLNFNSNAAVPGAPNGHAAKVRITGEVHIVLCLESREASHT